MTSPPANIRHTDEPVNVTPQFLEREAFLAENIHPARAGATPYSSLHAILLTGATGYLGAYLLSDLLRGTDARIFCLVRAATETDAIDRLDGALSQNDLPRDDDRKRIVPILGDLAKKNLGISETTYGRLSKSVDAIYHSGAWVNHSHDYHMLRTANVGGTQEILRLGCAGKAKRVHYVSTLSVLSARAYQDVDVIVEDAPLRPLVDVSSGYSQSKWVAEKLVLTARQRGLPVAVYRPSLVGCNSQSGRIVSSDYFFPQFLRACILIKCFPEEYMDSESNIVTVDFVSKAIVNISLNPEFQKMTFHLSHPESLRGRDTFRLVNDLGYGLETIRLFDWAKRLKRYLKETMDESLLKLYPVFSAEANRREVRKNQGVEEPPLPLFGRRNTDTALSSSDLDFPSGMTSLSKMITYLVEMGIIPPAY